jgi:hypothetical protein
MYAGVGGERHSGHEDVRAYEVPVTLIGGGAAALLDCAAV